MKSLSDKHLGWIAGLTDGEGYIGLTRTPVRKEYGYLYKSIVHVYNTHREALSRLTLLTGVGSVSICRKANDRHKEGYVWAISTEQQIHFLSAIKSELVIKVEQAELLIEFLELPRFHKSREKSDEVLSMRSIIYSELQDLNAKGPK